MKMSDSEKLILIMLSELYEKLGINGEIDPNFIKEAIFSNNIWGISWKYPGLQFKEQQTPEIVKKVLDILDMWSSIEFSYKNLTQKGKLQLEKEATPFGKKPEFPGFDGNNESEYMSIALFIINDLNRFEEFKGRNLNSHIPSIDSYRRMLTVFEQIKTNLSVSQLSVANLIDILKEKIYPSQR